MEAYRVEEKETREQKQVKGKVDNNIWHMIGGKEERKTNARESTGSVLGIAEMLAFSRECGSTPGAAVHKRACKTAFLSEPDQPGRCKRWVFNMSICKATTYTTVRGFNGSNLAT